MRTHLGIELQATYNSVSHTMRINNKQIISLFPAVGLLLLGCSAATGIKSTENIDAPIAGVEKCTIHATKTDMVFNIVCGDSYARSIGSVLPLAALKEFLAEDKKFIFEYTQLGKAANGVGRNHLLLRHAHGLRQRLVSGQRQSRWQDSRLVLGLGGEGKG